MTNASGPSSPLFSSDALSPEALEEILRRIDENLELRPLLLASDSAATQPRSDEDLVLAPLPEMTDLSGRIHAVRSFNAPYFLVQERGLRGFVKRLINLPLRLFGYKQALFNSHALDMLALIALQLQALRHRSEQHAAEERQQRRWLHDANERIARVVEELDEPGAGVAEKSETNRQRIALLRADLETASTMLAAVREEVARLRSLEEQTTSTRRDLNGHSAWIQDVVNTQQELAKQLHGHTSWIEDVVKENQELARQLHGHTNWIELVQREVQAAAHAARSGVAPPASPAASGSAPPSAAAPLSPTIQDPARYAALLATMPDGLLVNLGCGIRPKEGWINVDFRPLSHVDVVADVRVLPFEPESVAGIEAAHLVEHFRQYEMQHRILPYWRSLLRPGGTLRIICPNLAEIIARSASGRLALDEVKDLLFGGQEYEGNDHFAMYWPESLQQMLTAAGFSRVDVIAVDRDNGICPEVEVLAQR
jgi:predicted  nucleic acid-binding Zn-ribbon protein